MPSQQPMKLASRKESRRSNEQQPARSIFSKYLGVGSLAVVALAVLLGTTGRTPGELLQGKLVTIDSTTGRTMMQPRLSAGLTYAQGEVITAEFKNIDEDMVLIPLPGACVVKMHAGENIYIDTLPTSSQCTVEISSPEDPNSAVVTWPQLDLSGQPVQVGRYRFEVQAYFNGVLKTVWSNRFRIHTAPAVAPTESTTTTLPPGTVMGVDPFGNPIVVPNPQPSTGQTQ